jgi:hypothetical protein
LIRWMVVRIGKVGRDVVKTLIISSVIVLAGPTGQVLGVGIVVRVKFLILIIKSTNQPW